MIKKTNKNILRRNKYILENILSNIFKLYILKYIIKFLQSHDSDKKKNSAFIISQTTCKKLAEHRLRTSDLEHSRSIGQSIITTKVALKVDSSKPSPGLDSPLIYFYRQLRPRKSIDAGLQTR